MVTESNKRIKTKRIIQEAMVDLLHRESFDEISTVQLAKEAGISRSSFYTHYRDKYDMIERYQQEFFHKVDTSSTNNKMINTKLLPKFSNFSPRSPSLLSF